MKTNHLVALALAAIASLTLVRDLPAQEQTPPPAARMTTYYVGLIYQGPKWSPYLTPEVGKLQQDHLEHIRKLSEEGKLILSGRFADEGDLRGMLFFKVATLQEARDIVRADPAVSAGQIRIELHPWYAPSGLRSDATPPDDEAGSRDEHPGH